MDKLKSILAGTGIVGIILFIVVLVIGFKIASALLVAALYVVVFIFLIALGVYLYRKAKDKIGGGDPE